MKGFACSAERLVRWFKQSRDKWKARAAEKQKRIKSLNVKVRDLLRSRDHWKLKAKQLQDQIHQIELSHKSKPKLENAGADFGTGSRSNEVSSSEQSTALTAASLFCPQHRASTASTRS